jgi:hypothetical protein
MRALITLIFIAACAMNMPASASNGACFDDEHLQHLLSTAKQRGTLVYVWSPRMVYSVHNAAIASRAAAAAGLDFVVLHDIRVPEKELIQLREAGYGLLGSDVTKPLADIDLATPPLVSPLNSSQPLCSEQLTKRDALRHFPSAFVITTGGIHTHPVVGAMPFNAWVSSLDQRLKQP